MTRTELSTAGSSQKLSLWVDLSWSSTVCGARRVILLGEVTTLQLWVARVVRCGTEGVARKVSIEGLLLAEAEPTVSEMFR